LAIAAASGGMANRKKSKLLDELKKGKVMVMIK
jgi:hypothetical protein